ncbi:MAG TPA: hypothetical protein VEX15_15525 [Nocardioidaceae bacterium]|nr:hypothetical protein [Nocardioidaceae bacterium]
MYVDNGDFFDGPFKYYEATPDSIEASAVELDRSYGNVEALSSDVDENHRMALTGVSGTIAGPLAQAPEPQRQNARDVMEASVVAAGSVRIFGHAVQTYNEGIDGLNQRWREAVDSDFGVASATYPADADLAKVAQIDGARADAVFDAKVALLKDLNAEREVMQLKLDEHADEAAAQLHAGPTDVVIQKMFAAGGLPSYVVAAFPHLKLEASTLPPDLANLSEFQIEDYLLAHPEIADAVVNPLLAKDGLTDQEQLIVEAQARLDADVLRAAMTGPDALERIQAATARLKLINAHVAKTGVLNDAAHSYTVAYVNEVGADNLAKLPSVVQANATSVHQDLDALTKTYLSPISDAILNLSNEQLQDETSGENGPGYATTYKYDFNGDGVIDQYDLPKAVRELDAAANDLGSAAHYDALTGYADLISSSTVEGGLNYSKHLTISVMQALHEAHYYGGAVEGDPDGLNSDELLALDQHLTDVFDVTSRNHEAMHDLITGENMGGFDGLEVTGGTDDPNDFEEYDPRDFLHQVYTTEWADNGANAAQMIDWMGEEHASNGEDKALADDAFRSWFDTMTGTGDGAPSGHEDGLFHYLMEQADLSEGAGETSFGQMNPELANSLSQTTVNYLDWLSGASEDPNPDETGADRASDGVMDNAEKVRLMMLGATTDDSAQILGVGIAGFQQGNGLSVGTDGASDVGAENARLQAYYDAGLNNEAMTRTDNAQDAANEAAARKQAVIDVFRGAAGGVPVGDNPLMDVAKGAFLAGVGAETKVVPEDVLLLPPHAETTNHDPAEFKYGSTYDLLQTQVANGKVDPADLPPELVDGNGNLRAIEDIEVEQPGVGGDDAPSMDTVRNQIEKVLLARGVDARAYTTDLWDTFDSLRDQYALHEDEIADFNEHGELPRR